MRLDNAALLAHRLYATDLDLFDAIWVRNGGDLRETVVRIIQLAKTRPDDPFAALKDWLERATASSAAAAISRVQSSRASNVRA